MAIPLPVLWWSRTGNKAADVQTRDEEFSLGDGDVGGDETPVVKLATMLITNGIKMKASDIHLEPMEKEFRVRYRIDGALRKMDSPPKRLQQAIISRIKIMSKMKISEKRIPQDGRIQITVNGKDLDLRVNTVPTNHGESIVMRVLTSRTCRWACRSWASSPTTRRRSSGSSSCRTASCS